MIPTVIDAMRESEYGSRRVASSGPVARISRDPLDFAHSVDCLALFVIVNRVVKASGNLCARNSPTARKQMISALPENRLQRWEYPGRSRPGLIEAAVTT